MSSRRVVGLETEYGVSARPAPGAPEDWAVSVDDVAQRMFRRVLTWGRGSSVFLANGGRVYLDVGSHPEYASAECLSLRDLLAQDRAGDALMLRLAAEAERLLAAEGRPTTVHLFRNNVDSAGNTYGCHENYQISRRHDLTQLSATLVPLLIVRQLLCGAGRVARLDGQPVFSLSQRAEHIDSSLSSSTTRARPIINTRDEPHADSSQFRRLHVIVGDTTMSQPTTALKVAMVTLALTALERGMPLPAPALRDPHLALRTVSLDPTGRSPLAVHDGGSTTALDLLEAYLEAVADVIPMSSPEHQASADLWRRAITALQDGAPERLVRELDWVAKRTMLHGYAARHDLPIDHPRVQAADLAWHELHPTRGLFQRWEGAGLMERIITSAEEDAASHTAPQDTRARLRGRFVAAAQRNRMDHTVDWMHLRLDTNGGRALVLSDPLRSEDQRVEELVAQMSSPSRPAAV